MSESNDTVNEVSSETQNNEIEEHVVIENRQEVNEQVIHTDVDPVSETELEPVEFSYDEESAVDVLEKKASSDLKNFKYTKIDCLDEDVVIPDQIYALMSFVSPEGVMNCNVRGVKVRGVYATRQEADTACEKLKKQDKYFDIFVGEVGKWLPWDPTSKQVKEEKHRNKKLDKIMNKIHQNEMSTLNEVVGRTKDTLDTKKQQHKKRVKKSIKDSVAEYQDPQDLDDVVETKEPSSRSNKNVKEKKIGGNHDANVARERLQRIIKAKKEARENSKENKDLNESKEKQQQESDRIAEQRNVISSLKETNPEIENKLTKMKELLRKKKAEKSGSE
jgi:hypothetical protein